MLKESLAIELGYMPVGHAVGKDYEMTEGPTPCLARPQQRSSASVAQDGLTFSQPVNSFATL